jgi:hypothetical protein
MANREYLTIDGQRYRVQPGSLRLLVAPSTLERVAGADLSQLVIRSPFESGAQVGVQGGEGLETTAGPQSTGYLRGKNLQPDVDRLPSVGNLRAKLAPALQTPGAWPGLAVSALAVYRGALYVGFSNSSQVWKYSGGAWSVGFTTGKAGTGALCVWRDKLYVGNLTDGAIQTWDGTTLTTTFTVAGGFQGTALAVGSFGGTRLYAGMSHTVSGQQGQVQSWDGVAQSTVLLADERRIEALCWADGVLYTAAGEPENWRGALYRNTANSSGSSAQVSVWRGTYPLSLALHQGSLYLGMAWGGAIEQLGSGGPAEVARFGGTSAPAGLPGGDAVRALLSVGERLYAGDRKSVV